MTLMQYFPYPLLNQGGAGLIIVFFWIAFPIVATCLSVLVEQLVFIDAKKRPQDVIFKKEKPFRNDVFKESLMVILFPIVGSAGSDFIAGEMAAAAGTNVMAPSYTRNTVPEILFGSLFLLLALYILFRSKDTFAVRCYSIQDE